MATLADSPLDKLKQLGVEQFEHIDGSLIEHLMGTCHLLKQWQAEPCLQYAGLYHAVYGTTGFDEQIVAQNQREIIIDIIGVRAETLVYRYCAADRMDFYEQVNQHKISALKNRFTHEEYELDDVFLRDFCELTVANEVEIAVGNEAFVAQHGAYLYNLFNNMQPYLSEGAIRANEQVFGKSEQALV